MIFIKVNLGNSAHYVNVFNLSYQENNSPNISKFTKTSYPTKIFDNGAALFVTETVEEIEKLISAAVVNFLSKIQEMSV